MLLASDRVRRAATKPVAVAAPRKPPPPRMRQQGCLCAWLAHLGQLRGGRCQLQGLQLQEV